MSEPIRAAIVGFGMAARVFHAPFLRVNARIRVTHVLERHREESRQVFPGAQIVRSLNELLRAPVDLVIVTTPNTSHFEIAAAALRAGKHVVVDKPFTLTSADAERLIALAERGRLLSVYHNRRWDGDFETIRRLLEQKQLGRLVEFESAFYRFRPVPRAGAWREEVGPGAGLLYDLGPHLIDQALVLFGWPQEVTAELRAVRDGALVDDWFELCLDYPGLRVRLKATLLAHQSGPRFVLHGARGSFVKVTPDPQEAALKAGEPADRPGWGVDAPGNWGLLSIHHAGQESFRTVETAPGRYHGYYENICDAIAGRAPLAVTAQQGRDTVRIIELAMQSNKEGRTVACDGG